MHGRFIFIFLSIVKSPNFMFVMTSFMHGNQDLQIISFVNVTWLCAHFRVNSGILVSVLFTDPLPLSWVCLKWTHR